MCFTWEQAWDNWWDNHFLPVFGVVGIEWMYSHYAFIHTSARRCNCDCVSAYGNDFMKRQWWANTSFFFRHEFAYKTKLWCFQQAQAGAGLNLIPTPWQRCTNLEHVHKGIVISKSSQRYRNLKLVHKDTLISNMFTKVSYPQNLDKDTLISSMFTKVS